MDSLRGVAILMMVTYHTLKLLKYFGGYGLSLTTGFWHGFQVATASAFIFLAGVSLVLSYSRTERDNPVPSFPRHLKHGLEIFALGLVVTVGTLIFLGRYFVRFGILHLIGLSIILASPFLKQRRLALPVGILCICIGVFFRNFLSDFPPGWLFWLVFLKSHFKTTVDYFPLLPWFGVLLLGVGCGGTVYRNPGRRFCPPDWSNTLFIKQVCFLGRHSLVIYFIHMPVLLGILYLFGIIRR